MSQLFFTKPSDMRYVDMCIAIDNEIYAPDCDHDKIYTYMWCIAYMLACKKKYFTEKRDYEEFASMLATSTYQRMTDHTKCRVKSVLNYMKSIMYFRKAAFDHQRCQEIIDPAFNTDWDPVVYETELRGNIELANRQIIVNNVVDIVSEIPLMIHKSIPRVYKNNKLIYRCIYKSSLLSIINRFTLSTVSEEKLQRKLKSPSFNEVNYYRRYVSDDVILWHLPNEFENVVKIILNKTYNKLAEEIKSLTDDIKISDEEFRGMVASVFTVSGSNNETNY